MTSLIFGSIYMTHQGVMAHRRGKQRQKNYERWEDLRDEYDEQKKITRETRSLDLQRTGAWDNPNQSTTEYTARDERPILTLRDQQEANDARMSWRPQEAWENSHQFTHINPSPHQRDSSVPSIPPPAPHTPTPSAYWQSRGELKPQRTGAAWDDGLPAPLRVTRRTFDDYEYTTPRRDSAPTTALRSEIASRTSSLRQSQTPMHSYRTDDYGFKSPVTVSVDPVESAVPGGPMAMLIERGY